MKYSKTENVHIYKEFLKYDNYDEIPVEEIAENLGISLYRVYACKGEVKHNEKIYLELKSMGYSDDSLPPYFKRPGWQKTRSKKQVNRKKKSSRTEVEKEGKEKPKYEIIKIIPSEQAQIYARAPYTQLSHNSNATGNLPTLQQHKSRGNK
jgi:hypothetical protein